MAAVSFSTTSAVQFNLNAYNNRQDTELAMRRIPFLNGYTDIAAGLALLVGYPVVLIIILVK